MSDDRAAHLAAIRERVNATTRGPWRFDMINGRVLYDGPGYLFGHVDDDGNGRFAAHAREDVPWLLAELAAAQEREAKLVRLVRLYVRAMQKADLEFDFPMARSPLALVAGELQMHARVLGLLDAPWETTAGVLGYLNPSAKAEEPGR